MDISELYQIYQAHPVITTDSRDCPEGSIFLALKGASFDGNKFADMALEKGCAYVIVDEKEYAKEGDERYILVEDCLTTFKELAREHRRHFDIPVVGITGTNGKTTTKELVSAVLGEKFNVMFTQGNFNNDVGVPKTLFRLSSENEIAVVEMGASHPGDIRKLVEYVEPTCGMITNVGRAHLQGFGSFEGVKKTKGELYDYLAANDALVFINADNEHLMQMAEQRNINLKTALFLVGGDASTFADTLLCFQEQVDRFGPYDFYTLAGQTRHHTATASIEQIIALFRLSSYDPNVVFDYGKELLEQTTQVSDGVRHELVKCLTRCWENFFPLGRDLPFEIARILLALRRPREAVLFNQHSMRLFGEHPVTLSNMGICHFYAEDFTEALRCFDRAMEINAAYGLPKAWRARVLAELGRK